MLSAAGLTAASVVSGGVRAHAAQIIPNDVWVDNVAAPLGPFHDDNRELSCNPMTVTGARFDHANGSFEINVIRPSVPHAQQVYETDWTFTRGGAPQVLATIGGQSLITKAQSLGARSVGAEGIHFEYRFLQHHHQHKPFWMSSNCVAVAAAVPPVVTPVPAPITTPTSGVKAAAVTAPKTGADVPWDDAVILVLAGTGCLGVARRLRRWRRSVSSR